MIYFKVKINYYEPISLKANDEMHEGRVNIT